MNDGRFLRKRIREVNTMTRLVRTLCPIMRQETPSGPFFPEDVRPAMKQRRFLTPYFGGPPPYPQGTAGR